MDPRRRIHLGLFPAGRSDGSEQRRSQDGKITAWDFHNYNSGEAGIRSYYNIPNQRIVFHEVDAPLRQGSYRGLAATANHFAREVHMDELAQKVGMDRAGISLEESG